MKHRARKRDQIIAIDLGGRTTKAVTLARKGEQFTLTNYALVDAASQEKSISPEVLTDHLKEIVRALDARSKHITLSLGVNDSVFRQADVPFMPVADLRQMLKFNTKNYLQQDFPDHVFDCHYLVGVPSEGAKPVGAQRHKVIIGGAKRQTIEDVQTAVRAAGLIPDQLVPYLVGPVNAFELAQPEAFAHEVVALVELGFKNSSILILCNGEIMLHRVVAIGGDQFTTGLGEALSISYQEAENIKVGMPGEVQQNLEPLIQPLGRELRASIDFFEHQQDKTVAKVYLSGGPARGEFIVQSLQAELMVPCQAWSPTGPLQLGLPAEKMGELEQIAPQLAVAIGAAAVSF